MLARMARSKCLGVLLGVMLGAGSAFAATTVYNYATTVQATATVVQGQVITAPGLEVVGGNSINFGQVEQGATKTVNITVKNVGREALTMIKAVGRDLPAGLSVSGANTEVPSAPWGGGGAPGYIPGRINPGQSVNVALELKVAESLAPGSYQFQIEITGVK